MSELDDQVGQEVMDYTLEWDADDKHWWWRGPDGSLPLKREDWSPTTHWDHAGMVLDKMRADGYEPWLLPSVDDDEEVYFQAGFATFWAPDTFVEDTDIKRGWCLAALAAKRAEP